MNQQDAARWADEVEKIFMEMVAGYRRMGMWDEFCARYGEDAPERLTREAMCAWVKLQTVQPPPRTEGAP